MKTVIVGGGPSGMSAAIAAAGSGAETVLIEKNEKLGRKLYITGKGRCNLTNNCDTSVLLNNVVRNPRFLYSAFNAFTPADAMDLIEKNGTPLKTERGGRVFPASDKSSDVIKAFKKALDTAGVEILTGSTLKNINTVNGVVVSVTTDSGIIECGSLVLACGGISYPLTGSSGEIFPLIKKLGHTVTPFAPALVPVELSDAFLPELAGLSLKNVTLKCVTDKGTYEEFGEMLFTHTGISGPITLTLSSLVNRCSVKEIVVDLKPALDIAALEKRVLRDFDENKNRKFINALGGLFPKSLIPVIVELSGINPGKPVNSVTREERTDFVKLIKNFPLTFKSLGSAEEGIVTSGGIKVEEINPGTMESKIVKNLFFAGEMIDVDAFTGGFNIQIALSTGYLAGINAAYV